MIKPALAIAALALAAPAALAQPLSCQPPAVVATPPAAIPDGPVRLLPITNYVLSLTWAPDVCDAHPGDPDAAFECQDKVARFGFVLHGDVSSLQSGARASAGRQCRIATSSHSELI